MWRKIKEILLWFIVEKNNTKNCGNVGFDCVWYYFYLSVLLYRPIFRASPDGINSINLIARFRMDNGMHFIICHIRMGVRERHKISRCNLCTYTYTVYIYISGAHERDISVLMQPLFGNKTFVKPDVQR